MTGECPVQDELSFLCFTRNIDPADWALVAGEAPGDPITFEEAINGPKAPQWMESMRHEYTSLVSRDGTVSKEKARLCAKGFTQVQGLDFTETFAPTVKFTTLRVIFSIAAHLDLHMEQTDVDCAFLYASLDEEIYMEQPKGFVEYGPDGSPLVCRLLKAVYGLKQAPHNWHRVLQDFMTTMNCRQLRTDPGAYVYRSSDSAILAIIAIYVDDILIASNSMTWIASFKESMAARFDIKDLGSCSWLLGVKVERDRTARTITIHQSKYIHDLLARFGMEQCCAAKVPSVANDPRESEQCTETEVSTYRSLVGALLYAAVATRPDIAESVARLCRFMSTPTKAHMEDARHCLRYLKGTHSRGITFGGDDKLALHGYSDANFPTTYPSQCKSTTGYVFFLCGGAISFLSKLQALVALSTAEAEYIALCMTVQEAVFLRQMLEELGFQQTAPTPVGEDNQACIVIATTDVTSARTKHLDIRLHFVRDAHQAGSRATRTKAALPFSSEAAASKSSCGPERGLEKCGGGSWTRDDGAAGRR
eukprot:jgi/Tetstr1/443701/TSEL_031691.t1